MALASAHLLGYILVNRLFSPWSRAELRQVVLILYLSFFLVSALTISPWYFPLYVAWVVFAGSWLTLQSGADPNRPGAWAPALAGLLAAGALLGGAVFLIVPRVEGMRRFNPFVASGMDKLQIRSSSVTGFTDRVTLGNFGTLRRSPARALRLHPEPLPRPREPRSRTSTSAAPRSTPSTGARGTRSRSTSATASRKAASSRRAGGRRSRAAPATP